MNGISEHTRYGNLQVEVYEKDTGKPLCGVKIWITQKDCEDTISELTTDDSGQSISVKLPCPPAEYSLNPEQPKPYSKYDVWIEHENYGALKISGVEILEGTSAIQPVMLKKQTGGRIETISIKEHTLFETEPNLFSEEGNLVLDKITIPEYIVVHDGMPDDALAKNYYIRFKDYVKNAACCEIYPTWPSSAITANVLAIISFTLNRICSGWYRSKGKNFTITSSGFDYAFIYGRNIYKEVSEIVDEIFSNYFAELETRRPLFIRCCDGVKNGNENWMSKWGSKHLSDQGYNALDIIKKYYGKNIDISQADQIMGSPWAYPSSKLQVGSSGRAVQTIQEQIATISNWYPSVSRLKIDGNFGNETKLCVEKLQRILGLPETGAVDYSTWYRITDVYVTVKKHTELI